MKILKSFLKFILLFLFLLFLVYFCVQPITTFYDTTWSYGFAYSIARGEIPYVDFTMVIPPAYAFIMSIGLKLISTNYIVYLVEHAFILTINILLLEKIYKRKACIFLFVFIFPMFYAIAPTYNYFLFFLLTLIIFCEKSILSDKKHYLIGAIIALSVLTKQTVGIFFIIPSLIYYRKHLNILLKRFIGFMIPILLFIIYLLITNSFMKFIDICLLGLFDFSKTNSNLNLGYLFFSIVFFVIHIIIFLKNRKNITIFYSVFGFIVMIPIFNIYHFYVYLLFFCLGVVEAIKKDITFKYMIIIFSLTIIYVLMFCCSCCIKNASRIEGINNFNNCFLTFDRDNFIMVNDYYNKYKKKGKTYFLSSKTVLLNIINDEDTNFFTVLNKGNYGYDGTDKMIKRVNSMENMYFIIDMDEYHYTKKYPYTQFDCDIIDYIIEHSKKIDTLGRFYVYYKE